MTQCQHKPQFMMTKWGEPMSYVTKCVLCGEVYKIFLPRHKDYAEPVSTRLVPGLRRIK